MNIVLSDNQTFDLNSIGSMIWDVEFSMDGLHMYTDIHPILSFSLYVQWM